MEDGAVMIKADDAAVAEAPKGSRKPFGAVLKAILPVVLFFVAIQFHACLECIVIGVQVQPMCCPSDDCCSIYLVDLPPRLSDQLQPAVMCTDKRGELLDSLCRN